MRPIRLLIRLLLAIVVVNLVVSNHRSLDLYFWPLPYYLQTKAFVPILLMLALGYCWGRADGLLVRRKPKKTVPADKEPVLSKAEKSRLLQAGQ